MPKERDISIDIIKFFAVLLIINSHADVCYPKYSAFATGGAIGDCLFLFCSGYTLFFGKMMRLDNYMKRRINRIYPSAFAAILVILAFQGDFNNLSHVIVMGAGRNFLNAIMVYYVILWFVRKYLYEKIPLVFALTVLVTLIAYWFFPHKYETGNNGIYGYTTIFRWIPYFGMMLMGAYLGVRKNNFKFSLTTDALMFFVCLVAFYGVQFASKKNPIVAPFQIITLVFLLGIIFYFWKICNAEIFTRIYRNKYGNWFVMSIGGLCLESYLTQFCVLTDKLNFIFPLNLPIVYVAVLIVAYFCRCLARIFAQTFKDGEYDWREVVRI